MFVSFLVLRLGPSICLSFLLSFIFTLWSATVAKSNRWQVLFIFLINTRSLGGLKMSNSFVSQNNISFSNMDPGLCIYHLIVWSNFNLLHNYQRINFPSQLYLLLYSINIIIIWFSTLLSVSKNSSQSLYPIPRVREVSDYRQTILCATYFGCYFLFQEMSSSVKCNFFFVFQASWDSQVLLSLF